MSFLASHPVSDARLMMNSAAAGPVACTLVLTDCPEQPLRAHRPRPLTRSMAPTNGRSKGVLKLNVGLENEGPGNVGVCRMNMQHNRKNKYDRYKTAAFKCNLILFKLFIFISRKFTSYCR